MSRIQLTAASRVGSVRSNNEDMVLAYDRLVRSDAYQTEWMTENVYQFVIAVADGMGGHSGGEVASEMVLRHLKYFVSDLPRGLKPQQVKKSMEIWLTSVNTMVNSNGFEDVRLREMGTTLVGILYYEGHYYWMNCGDSRLYRYRDNRLEQMTIDHSLNNVTGERKHSNIITNCIGAGSSNLYLDMIDFSDNIKPGDVYMLCSDGLNDMLSNQEIERLLGQDITANGLCRAAIEAGGYDNVSVIVIKIAD